MEPRFRFEFIPAPEDLAPYVNTLFVFSTDEERLDDILPAYSAQLISFGTGAARMQFAEDRVYESSTAFVIAPMQEAAPFSIAGPAKACGISLTSLGWAAFAHLPVDDAGHRVHQIEDLMGGEVAHRLSSIGTAYAAGECTSQEAGEALASFLRDNLLPPSDRERQFIEKTVAWLSSSFNPPIDALIAATGDTERNVQRLCKKFFGKPPASLVKRYRAMRAATILSQPNVPSEIRDEAINAFFDQAHMVRDIRRFTGRTPTGLGGEGFTVTSDTLGPEGYGVVDLFGGAGIATDPDGS